MPRNSTTRSRSRRLRGRRSMPVLPDVLRPGLRIVFCGTGAGRRSAEVGAYYAMPGNRFWPTLHAVGLTPRQLEPREFPTGCRLPHRADRRRQGACRRRQRTGGGRGRRQGARNAYRQRSRPRFSPSPARRRQASSSRRPTGRIAYGLQESGIGSTRLFVLPSPSGLATSYWSIEPWREAARLAGARGR